MIGETTLVKGVKVHLDITFIIVSSKVLMETQRLQ
jgi:hypothetical protein